MQLEASLYQPSLLLGQRPKPLLGGLVRLCVEERFQRSPCGFLLTRKRGLCKQQKCEVSLCLHFPVLWLTTPDVPVHNVHVHVLRVLFTSASTLLLYLVDNTPRRSCRKSTYREFVWRTYMSMSTFSCLGFDRGHLIRWARCLRLKLLNLGSQHPTELSPLTSTVRASHKLVITDLITYKVTMPWPWTMNHPLPDLKHICIWMKTNNKPPNRNKTIETKNRRDKKVTSWYVQQLWLECGVLALQSDEVGKLLLLEGSTLYIQASQASRRCVGICFCTLYQDSVSIRGVLHS